MAPAVQADGLTLPEGATRTAREHTAMDSLALPTGPWRGGGVETVTTEGAVTEEAWRIRGSGRTTLQLLRPLRAQLRAEGYEILYECKAEECGGFDFRYATETLPEPAMHVDLGDYRFLSAQRDTPAAGTGGPPERVSLMVSRSAESGFVQFSRIAPAAAPGEGTVTKSTKTPSIAAAPGPAPGGATGDDIAARLQADGRARLDGVDFGVGSARLDAASEAGLAGLAGWLNADPARRVALVGHTDIAGGFSTNIALSRERAAAIRDRLIAVYDVAGSQVTAEGVGYLAPAASNATDAGRSRNRRVEAVVTDR